MLRGVNGAGGGAPIGGGGTLNTIPRWTGASTLGDSIITQDAGATAVAIGSSTFASNARLTLGGANNSTVKLSYLNAASEVAFDSINGSTGERRAQAGAVLAGWGGYFTWYTETTEKMRLTAAGNVGIGTASPGSKLTIGSGAYAGTSLDGVRLVNGVNSYFTASDGTRTSILGADGSAFVGTLTNHDFQLRANNSVAATIQASTGYVGIGTASPQEKTQVYGNLKIGVTANDSFLTFGDEGTTSRFNGIYRPASSNTMAIGSYNLITFNVSNAALGSQTERARIDSSGNFGIGTTAIGGSRLAVNGGALPSGTVATGALYAAGSLASGRLCPALSSGTDLAVLNTFFDSSNLEISSGTTAGWTSGIVISARSASSATTADTVTFYTQGTRRVAVGTSSLDASLTSGYGLKLPATPGNTDPNTLDAYVDGGTAGSGGKSYTVTDTSGAGLTITVTSASYIQIGKLVVIQYDISYPVTASAATASLSIPIAGTAGVWQAGSMAYQSVGGGFISPLAPAVQASALNFWSNSTQQTNANLSNKRMILTVSYFAA
jgi:hypothetical protein